MLLIVSISSTSAVIAVFVFVSAVPTFSTPVVGPFELKLILLDKLGDRTPRNRYIKVKYKIHLVLINLTKQKKKHYTRAGTVHISTVER